MSIPCLNLIPGTETERERELILTTLFPDANEAPVNKAEISLDPGLDR